MQRQKSFQSNQPTLYLVATPIGNLSELSPRAIETLNQVDVIAAEDTRNTGTLLAKFAIKTPMITYHLFNEADSAQGIIDLLNKGESVAIVSDAGYPLVSDPGQTLVNLTIQNNFPVVVINGPSACLTALVASGLPVQPFCFYGFLDAKDTQRVKQLEKLKKHEETLIFYEAPHRIERMLKDVLMVFGDRKICIGRELTKKFEEYLRGNVSEILEVIGECKGEMVVVVEGYNPEQQPVISMMEMMNTDDEYIKDGMTTSEAIKKAAKDYGVSKNEIYHQYFS